MNNPEYFPVELLTKIILECNYKSKIQLKLICSRFNNVIQSQKLLDIKSNINYPRITSKAQIHKIKTNFDPDTSDTYIMNYTLCNIINNDLDVTNGDIILMDKTYRRGDDMKYLKIMPRIYTKDSGTRGPTGALGLHPDMINTKFVFYNCKLYPIIRTNNYNYNYFLSDCCIVITNNVPIDYWDYDDLGIGNNV